MITSEQLTMSREATPTSSDVEKSLPNPDTKPIAHEAPDGGLTAWLVVLGGWCTSFCSFGWLNSVGAFQEYYQNDLLKEYSTSTVSWIPSLQIFIMMAAGPFVGTTYDRHGPRMLLLVGSFLHVFGIMMTSLGKEYYQILLAQGVCSAIGAAMIFQPAMNCMGQWFNKKRGAAFGILATGSSIGGVVFPIMTTKLIRIVGFGWSMRICGFLLLALLVIANLTVKTLVPPAPHKVAKAELARPFKEPTFVLIALGFFFLTFAIFIPINYLPVQALDLGMSENLTEYLVPILNAASLFGRLFSGFAGDKIGRFNIFIAVCYLTAIWMLALWIPVSDNAGIIAFAALFGFTSGAYVSLIPALVMQISPMTEIGFRVGMIFLFNSIGGLTTGPINGAILASAGGWVGVKVFSGVFCVVGTTFILCARIRAVGWSLAKNF